MSFFKDFSMFEGFLDSLGMFRMELGLERMHKALDVLGIAPDQVPCVQIVGTNGKGSTACFLESLARSSGLKTGLYTSPHLVSVRERIRINRELVSEEVWVIAANHVLDCCQGLELTYFELLTVMAVRLFDQEGIDLAIMEAGLGGKYDATSALTPVMNVFTPVARDHTPILGNTLEEIARDKSMAMKQGPVIAAGQNPVVMDVLRARAGDMGADMYPVSDYFDFDQNQLKFRLMPGLSLKEEDIGLKGYYQLENAAGALLAWKILADIREYRSDVDKCVSALKTAFWPGRLHVVQQSPMIILDGAHNVHALQALKNSLRKMKIKPATIIFSCLMDKDVQDMVKEIKYLGARQILIPEIRDNPRAMPVQKLVTLFGHDACPLAAPEKYLAALTADHAPVLVCGSLYLLGQIYSAFPQWLER
ncbi:MAG: bifunctional folylpolyglutamate synthase/dihydrofolate synthase [Desulfonatronovibrio sp.]